MGVALFVGGKCESIGGMQTHYNNVIKCLKENNQLNFIIYRFPNLSVYDCANNVEYSLSSIGAVIKKIQSSSTFFFNDGWWINEWQGLKDSCQNVLFVYRTGGNEFVKAPYKDNHICLEERQKIWGDLINKSIDFVISNSRFTTKRLKLQGVNSDKILTIRGGVDFSVCKKNFLLKTELRKAFDEQYQTGDKIVFAMVSRFDPFKGILEILDVFAELKDRKEFFLLLVGNGEQKEEITNFCQMNIDSSQYCILPETDNYHAMRYIAISDYYLNCSLSYRKKSGKEEYIHTETMGRSLFEAIYQYVPVIATFVGGIPELFDEFEQIGALIDESKSEKKNIIQTVLNKESTVCSCGERFESYGWEYITSKIYEPLFRMKKNRFGKKSAICLDMDGTIYHQMLDENENVYNLKQILLLSDVCEIIINSAANYDEILERHPIFKTYINKITIISNCGKHLYIYGEPDLFWENYMESIPGIQSHMVQKVHKEIISSRMKLISTKYIDRLYVNYKIDGMIDCDVVKKINIALENTQYMLVYNSNNLKLVSRIANKAAPINYLRIANPNTIYWIGAGNNVLDFSFLDLCDMAYIINCDSDKYNSFLVEDSQDMMEFINLMKREVNNYINNG